MDRVERQPARVFVFSEQVALQERHRVVFVELKRVVRLRPVVDTDHVETSPVVAHRGATSSAEQVEETGFHRCLQTTTRTPQLIDWSGSRALGLRLR